MKSIITALLVASIPLTIQTAQAADDGHGELKQNVIGLFLGGTSVSGDTNFTIGGEYEFRFNEMFGAGFVIENTSKAHHGDGTTLYMGQIYVHPWQELRLQFGYGKEDIHHAGAASEDVWRAGVSYDFHVGEFGIAPTFTLDRVGGHTAKVFGIALVKAF